MFNATYVLQQKGVVHYESRVCTGQMRVHAVSGIVDSQPQIPPKSRKYFRR